MTDKKIEIKEFEEKFAVLLEKWKLSPDFSYEYLIKETSNMVTDLLNTEVQKAREDGVRGFMKVQFEEDGEWVEWDEKRFGNAFKKFFGKEL